MGLFTRPAPTVIPGKYSAGAEPFLAAVVANPSDDTTRLVFADWLQEQGDEERAVFIRDQIALYRLHPTYTDEEVRRSTFRLEDQAQYERMERLFEANMHKWLDGFRLTPTSLSVSLPFRRGFPYRAQLTPERWVDQGEWLRRWVPLESVIIEGQGDQFAELMTSPTLFGLSELSLSRVGTAELSELANSPALDSLESLHVQGRNRAGTVEVPTLRRLFGSSRLKRLRSLLVWIDRAGDTLGFVVGGSPHLRNLELLELSDGMRDEAARDLFESPNVANLISLALPDNPVGDVAIRGLVRSKYLTRLRTLRLQNARLTTGSGRLLAGWSGLHSLTLLYLDGNELGLEGIRALSESRHIGQLHWLAITDNVAQEKLDVVHGLPGFAHIRHVF